MTSSELVWHVLFVHALPALFICFAGTPFIEYQPKLNWWQKLIATVCLLSVAWLIYGMFEMTGGG